MVFGNKLFNSPFLTQWVGDDLQNVSAFYGGPSNELNWTYLNDRQRSSLWQSDDGATKTLDAWEDGYVEMGTRKLGRSRLADDHCPAGPQRRDTRRIRDRPVTAINRRAVLGRHVNSVHYVLYANGDAVQRSLRSFGIARPGLSQRYRGVDKGPGMNIVITRLNTGQTMPHQFLGVNIAPGDFGRRLDRSKTVEAGRAFMP